MTTPHCEEEKQYTVTRNLHYAQMKFNGSDGYEESGGTMEPQDLRSFNSSSSNEFSVETFQRSGLEAKESLNSPIALTKLDKQNLRDSSTATTESETTTFDDAATSEEFEHIPDVDCFKSILEGCPRFRQTEKNIVRSLYESRIGTLDGKGTFLLIEGPSGSGKTNLAKSLQRAVSEAGGYFLTGKFDFLQHPAPYKAIVSAFTKFTKQVIERGDDEVEKMRSSILNAIGGDSSVLTSTIPALEEIIGVASKKISTARTKGAIQRFVFLFQKFVQSICSPEKPLILLLEDLHWSDECSLDVIDSLVEASRDNAFIVIGTVNNTIDNDYIRDKLECMKRCERTHVECVKLDYPLESCIRNIIAQSLEPRDKAELLGRIIYTQTSGNLSYLHWFFRWLQTCELVYFDKVSKQWEVKTDMLEEEVAQLCNYCYIAAELKNLSHHAQEVLKVAACLGFSFDSHLIEKILGFAVDGPLQEAVEKGFVVPEGSQGEYSFEQDVVHSGCYRMIEVEDKELFHIEITRRLWRQLDKNELEKSLFILLPQVHFGKNLVTRENERHGLANLCMHAGTKAAKASTFRIAFWYFKIGVSLLDDASWISEYELCLSLHNSTAEMAMCMGDFEFMDVLVDKVLLAARCCADKMQPLSTRIYSLGVVGRQDEAIDLAVSVLRNLGESLPSKPTMFQLCSEARKVEKLIRGKSDAEIMRMPAIVEEQKLASLQVLQLIFLTTMFSRPMLAPFVSLKMVRLTLEYGLSVYSSMAFACYGMTLVGAFRDVDKAFRFGNLALDLLDRYEHIEYLPRVYAAVYGCIYAWKKPIRDTLEPLLLAHKVGLQTGDFEFATLCGHLHVFNAVESGMSLDKVMKLQGEFDEISYSNRQIALMHMSKTCLQAVRCFMNGPEGLLTSTEGGLCLGNTVELKDIGWTYMAACYIFNEYEKASDRAVLVMKYAWAIPPTIDIISIVFWSGMIALQMVSDGKRRRKFLRRAKDCIKIIRNFCKHGTCNFADKRFLLEAELAKVNHNQVLALEKYTIAIALAKSFEFTNIEAVANERVARFWISVGKVPEAEHYYRQAHHAYVKWGAHGKADHLHKEMDGFFK